jgi:hypothetical protein
LVACYWKSREGLRRVCKAYDLGGLSRKTGWKDASRQLAKSNPNIFCGMFDHGNLRNAVREGRDFLYFDNPYFRRDEKHIRFRLIVGASHLTQLLPEQPGRVVEVPELEPWRERGRLQRIVVIPPSPTQLLVYGCTGWLPGTLKRLREATRRPVFVKEDKYSSFPEALADAWAVVTYASVAGVEAAVAGVPVFAGALCPALPISAGTLEEIESPRRPDRREWLRSLGYACWHMNELGQLDLETYSYAPCGDNRES